MSKPKVRAITPFDAALGTTVYFDWSGRQMKSNIATIKNASTGTVVYQEEYDSFKGVHVIPIGTESGLSNNTNYQITIVVVDMDDVQSEASDPVLFSCYTTPTITMYHLYEDRTDTITDGYVLGSSNIYIRIGYNHPSAETGNLLNTWRITLYNSSKVSLDYSNELYAANTLDYDFSGLLDLTEYYLRVEALTTSGMRVDTGYVKITVNYTIPAKFSNLSLVNNEDEGNIHIESFAISMTGRPKFEPVVYVEDEQHNPYAVDLTDGNEVSFNEGLDLNKTFTITMYISDLEYFEPFLILSDGNGNGFTMKYWKTAVRVNGATTHQYQVWLYGNNSDCSFSMWSNALTTEPASTDKLAILLSRDADGLFTLKLMNMSEEEEV